MGQMYYSPLKRGFYDPDLHRVMPDDAQPISEADYKALLAGQGPGGAIVPGADGKPVLQAPPAPTLDEARTAARAQITAWVTRVTRQFTAHLPAAEVASWPTKAMAAAAHTAKNPHPMIVAEAAITGEDPTALAATIRAKADLYTGIIARLTGLRRQTEAAVDAATTPADVDAALAAALKTATALAADLGLGTPA